jgi:acyl-CoA reductase-like NAD-dependent aldehyde dehydrogenase
LEARKAIMRKAADTLEANVDELGKLLVKEQGKPLTMAGKTGEVSWAIGLLRKVIDETKMEPEVVNETTKVYRRPIGVITGVTPWNFPVFCSVQKWGPSLLYGNTFVHKPSPFTPLTGLKIGELLKDVFPTGVFNVVSGDDKQEFNVGAYLSQHPKVNMVSFTGSVATGKKVMANSSVNGMRRVNIEAGGNDAAIVLPDADPATVAPGLFGGAFANSGQICCAIKRCYVHESIHDKVVDELVKHAKKAKFGDGFTEGVQFGPLNNKMQFDKVMGILEDTKKLPDVKVECGGGRMEGDAHKGYFIEPTIVTGIKEGARLVDEEQFGPVMPILKYKDEAEAIARANDSEMGLGGSVWSSNESHAADVASQIQAGTVWINAHTDLTGGPFGGFKESGVGREIGMADIGTFTEMLSVFVKGGHAKANKAGS